MPSDEGTEHIQDATDLDAELDAEIAKLEAIDDDPPISDDEPPEGDTDVETAETEDKPGEKPGMTPEEADETARKWLASRGHKVIVPGEEEAIKTGGVEEGKKQSAQEILASLPDVPLDQEVIALIDKQYGHDPVQRDAMFTRYATQVAVQQTAQQVSAQAMAPYQQQQAQAMWQAKAVATARDVATKAGVPEAEAPLAQLILEAGPDSEQRWNTDPFFKKSMQALMREAIATVSASLDDSEKKPLMTASRVGGGKAPTGPTDDGLSGEFKSMADGIREDVKKGIWTKAEGDAQIRDIVKLSRQK